MVESNINIVSNIYVRSDSDIKKDRQYIEKITGAKRIKEIQNRYYGFNRIPLTDVQNKIAQESSTCSYAENGEMSFGPVLVDGVLKWKNRCESSNCRIYEKCVSGRVPKIIPRENLAEEDIEEEENLQKFFESLGIKIQDDTVVFERDRNTRNVEENLKEYVNPTERSATDTVEYGKKYIEITEPDCIINSPLNSHIILNSGPGSGKTYTIIQRLIHILSNRLCPAEEIYILCYTRSAKNVVENKLEEAVTSGIISPSAKNICILTFDSYAAYFLLAMKDQGIITEDLSELDYNSRIKLFNKYAVSEDFEGISYFIVDEIQDLVNERAEMVLNILKHLKCGYLLAGDRCQSIYDYEADEDANLDSVKFYELAELQFPNDMLRYEITVNRRQSTELANEALEMRKVLLSGSIIEQNRYAGEIVKHYDGKTKIESYIKTLTASPTVSTAILCRNNGEAEYISGLLCEKGIFHTLNRGVNNAVPLPRWIADVFWDYCREFISRNTFIERFSFRCNSALNPNNVWQLLCKLSGLQDTETVSVPKLITALTVTNNIPGEFYEESPLLTVSTIHKAKGSEFDRVVMLESNIKPCSDSAEEARVRYVSFTRPKSQFITMKKNTKYFKRTKSGRVIETGLHNIYKKSNTFCKCITVGLTGDIDNNSFVSGDFESIIDLQEYIIHNVKMYDKVNAKLSSDSGLYKIIHNGRCIGSLSKKMLEEIEIGVKATDYKHNMPECLENLYISGITTEVLKKFSDGVPIEFQKSRICFGIQITGLARLRFEKK